MGEEQQDNLTYHFSKKVLILSLLFLAVNMALYGLFLYQKNAEIFHEVSPVVVFSGKQDIKVKTPFDNNFVIAKSGQILPVGSRIATGNDSYAELQLDRNILRLDKNTDIQITESNFQKTDLPRFSLQLYAGGVWVSAFDPIVILTDKSKARFSHTIGLYTYSKPLNRIFSVLGDVELTLYGDTGALLTKFIIPLKNQVTYVDTQLIPDYSKLEYTKLKKELKVSPISQSILLDEWIRNNTENEISRLQSQSDYIFSSTDYSFENGYHSLRAKFAFIPERKRLENLNLAAIKLKYLLGAVDLANNNELAKTILGEFDTLSNKLNGDPLFENLIESQFYTIRNVRTDTPAYLVKEDLRNYLLIKYRTPDILRTYLSDIDYLLRAGEVTQAENVADEWLKQWKPGLKKDYSDEFDQQSRIYHSTLLAYISKITPKLLAVLDETGDYRIKNAKSPDNVLFEIAMERLDISKYMIAAYRYTEAKTYLRTSYSNLKLSESTTSAAARDIFIQDATLLADRISFAEQSLKGAADKIDEAKFRDYLTTQERDKSLAERFTAFLQESQAATVEAPVYYPNIDDVSHEFAVNGIVVLDEDIIKDKDPDNRFEFDIKKASFINRAEDGSLITFTSRFNYPNKAVYDVILNGKLLKGNFTIEDLVRVVQAGGQDIKTPNTPSGDITNLVDFTNLQDSQDAQRSQIIAQDLAAQLVIKELEKYDILVSSTQQVVVMNLATLTEFRINNVYIKESSKNRQLQISFDYNSITKIVSDIILFDGPSVDFPKEVSIDNLIQTIFGIVNGKEREFLETKNVVNELSNLGFTLKPGDISFAGSDFNKIDFSNIRVKTMPIEFKGQYDRSSKMFIVAESPFLTSRNVSIDDYVSRLAELWLIDYLGDYGINIGKDNIATILPADKIDIKKYVRGSKVLNFTYDVNAGKLINISLEGVSTVVPSMTFEEFSLIQGAENTIIPVADKPVVSETQQQINDLIGTCSDFSERLLDCVKYSCSFPHPLTKETMIRRITGLTDDKCRYIEQMPENQYMECNYSAGLRATVAQEYKDLLTLGKILFSGADEDLSKFLYIVDGKQVADPAKEAISNGECVVGKQ